MWFEPAGLAQIAYNQSTGPQPVCISGANATAGALEARQSFTFTFVSEPLSRVLAAGLHIDPNAVERLATGLSRNRTLKPQVAFVTSAVTESLLLVGRSSIDFIGHFEDFESDWRRIRHFIPNWPEAHHVLLANMSVMPSVQKAGMAALESLPANSMPMLTPLCRVLLPDYVCFGYQVPRTCAQKLVHNVSCPLLPGELWARRK